MKSACARLNSAGDDIARWALAFWAFLIPFGDWVQWIDPQFKVARFVVPILAVLAVVSGRAFSWRPGVSGILIGLFALATLPSFVFNDVPLFPGFAVLVGYFLIYFVIDQFGRDERVITTLFTSYLIGLTVVGVLCVLALLGVDAGMRLFDKPMVALVFGVPRLFGTMENPNAFAAYFVFGVPMAAFLGIARSKLGIARWFWSTALALFVFLLLVANSRSCLLGVTFACAAGFLHARLPMRRVIAVALLVVGVTVAAGLPRVAIWISSAVAYVNGILQVGSPPVVKPSLQIMQDLMIADKSASVGIRWELLKHGVAGIPSVPLFGYGLEQTWLPVRIPGMMQEERFSLHNTYLSSLYSFGWSAYLLFLSIIGLFAYAMARSLGYREPIGGDAHSSVYVFISVAGYLVMAAFHDAMLNSLFWLGLSICLLDLEKRWRGDAIRSASSHVPARSRASLSP